MLGKNKKKKVDLLPPVDINKVANDLIPRLQAVFLETMAVNGVQSPDDMVRIQAAAVHKPFARATVNQYADYAAILTANIVLASFQSGLNQPRQDTPGEEKAAES